MKACRWASLILTLALIGSLVAACGSSSSSIKDGSGSNSGLEGELVIAGNGATVETLMKDKIFKKFNEKYPDVKLSYVSGVSTDIVAKVTAQQGSPQIDVTVIEGGEQEAGSIKGLWEALVPAQIPNMSKVDEQLKINDNSGVTVNYTPMGISYNAKLVKEKGLPVPESWNDLARSEMKGNLILTEMSSNFGRSAAIMLAYANGGSEKDMAAGFDKLKTIAGYMPTFAKTAAQLQQNLQNNTAAYTAWTMARSIVQKDQGVELEFVIPKEGANIVPNVASLVKGAKHPNAAKAFIDFLLTDDVQTLYATELFYNTAVNVKLPEDTAKLLDFDKSKIVKFDYGVISDNTKKWLDQFNKEVAPLVGQ
ncbi:MULTISPECIES: extracellular solute-binding protein [Paenibacillus]|uniref:extracellular solute-binding protein n=1 Tax=Paenibacillus TaxID=44249 RepID=UPI002282CEF0|nr:MULTISPECIES: extracellular solute-binding protein [Paenibacillus]MCY7483879.1 extracellular solute-binding protein [Paenibacillus alvei]